MLILWILIIGQKELTVGATKAAAILLK